jgi:hypothetical protein
MMTDHKRNQPPAGQPPDWQAPFTQLDDALDVEPTEMARLEQQFLSGVRKAQRMERRQDGRPRCSWRWALASMLTLALLIGGPLLLHERPAPVAAPYPGLQGQVISGGDLRPVSGVQVWLQAAGGSALGFGGQASRQLVDITDPAGFFDVPPCELDQPCQVVFTHSGEEVACLEEQPGQRDFTGYQQIMIVGSGSLPEESYWVEINPGQLAKPAPGLQVSLAASAAQWWYGALSHDQRWPAAFSYGCVLDGVYWLEGAPAPGLELTVQLDPAALEFFHASPEQVALISHSDGFQDNDAARGFHRGWYPAEQPPPGYGLAPVMTRLVYDKQGQASITWPAEPGVKYALKVPMQIEGELAFTYCYQNATRPECQPYLRLQLLNQTKPQLYAVQVWHDGGTGAGWQELTLQPRVHMPVYELCNSPELPDAPAAGFDYTPTGRWRLDLEDFTLQEHHYFEIDAPPTLPKPGQYKLEFTPGEVGGMSIARVTGDLDRLAQPPAWDLRCDFVDDAYGPEVELPAPYPGSYKVRVTLREKNGAITVLEDAIEVVDPELALFMPGPFNAVPVLSTVAGEPGICSELHVLTATALANPLPYGYSVSNLAGPVIRCDLPPELHGVSLRKIRIVQSATPAGGDTANIELQPELWLAPTVQAGPLLTGISEWRLPSGGNLDICNSGLSHLARYALARAEHGGDARALLAAGTFHDHYVAGIADSLKLKLGWDTTNLPPASEIVATLRQFRASPAFGRRTVTEFGQRLEWEFDLYGQHVPPGQDLLLGYSIETQGLLLAAQWKLDGREGNPSYIEIETDGQQQPWHGNIDYSPMFSRLLTPSE